MNSYNVLFDLIGTLARERYVMAERHFARLGLNHSEARLLNLLYREGGTASQETLSGKVYIDRSNVGRALKSLEDRRFILRVKDVSDKRSNVVSITDEGERMVVEIQKVGQVMAESFFGDLSQDQAAEVVRLLSSVTKGEDI